MKNLKSFAYSGNLPESTLGSIFFAGATNNLNSDNFLFVFRKSVFYTVLLPDCELKTKFDLSDIHPLGKDCCLISAHFNDIYEEIYAVFRTGEVIILKVDSRGHVLSENLDFFENGISLIKWSPNLESAVVLNEANELIVVNSSFDVLNRVELLGSSQEEQVKVSVGWGKKETQFKGSVGKKVVQEESADKYNDNFSNIISWRGDGLLFAVSYWCPEKDKRRIKIFDKEGILQSVGEDLTGLEEAMCWRPQGNLIALTQRFLNRYVITFIEKNGLKHGDFNLPKEILVTEITWNTASNILGLKGVNSSTNQNCILFYSTGNYHWYLKQTIKFSPKIIKMMWDESKENRLFVMTEDGKLTVIDFTWTINHSTYCQSDSAFVSVIDHDKILLTPFHVTVIPPPMSKWILECPSSINQIIYSPFHDDYINAFLCCVLSDNRLSFFKMIKETPTLFQTFDSPLPAAENDTYLGVWEWISQDMLVCCGPTVRNKSKLNLIKITADKLVLEDSINLNELVISMILKGSVVLLQTYNGKFLEFEVSSKEIFPVDIFPELCSSAVAVERLYYGLNESTKRLYQRNKQIASNVTSFFVKKPYLLATTSHHTLIILLYDGEKCEEVTLRKLEKGSKIVVVTGNSVIMQMPRGNLETIQPRALTILSIGSLLNNKKYEEAVHMLRKQRITFDLCVDHNPKEFISNVDHFIKEVDPQWITLMVTELNPSDVTQTVYAPYYREINRASFNNKIDLVCNAILDALVKEDSNKYMPSKLSCLVKLNKMSDAITMADDPNCLQHLLFLVDVELLYKKALETYNLNAALKIAEKSQMDPKEYVPYLNSLLKMEPNYMMYTIDKSLKRFKSALNHIGNCGDEKLSECYELIKEHNLYSNGLLLFSDNPQRYSTCASLYGEYLHKKRHFEEAGVMFLRGNQKERAIQSFAKSGNWRQCILLVKQLDFSDDDTATLGESLYNELISLQSYNEAANVAIMFLDDTAKALEAYVLGKQWQEAMFEVHKMEKPELKEIITISINEAKNNLYEDINNRLNSLNKYVERLQAVREEKLNKPKFRDFDEMSDTSSSVASIRSKSSVSRSSKMTRKMSRKLWSLKEGGPREEEALLATLSELIVSSQKYTGEIKNICTVLLHLKEDQAAKTLQNVMKQWLETIEDSKKIIWPRDPNEDITFVLDQKYKYPPDVNIDGTWELNSVKDC